MRLCNGWEAPGFVGVEEDESSHRWPTVISASEWVQSENVLGKVCACPVSFPMLFPILQRALGLWAGGLDGGPTPLRASISKLSFSPELVNVHVLLLMSTTQQSSLLLFSQSALVLFLFKGNKKWSSGLFLGLSRAHHSAEKKGSSHSTLWCD